MAEANINVVDTLDIVEEIVLFFFLVQNKFTLKNDLLK